jgi:hypothetical protein
MSTHRVYTEVEKRLYQWAWVRHKGRENEFQGLTFSEMLDELLKEVGF